MSKATYDQLISAYQDLRRYLSRTLGNPHDAGDIAQTSFEQAMRYAQGNEISSARQLIFQIARNLCIDQARRNRLVLWESLDHAQKEAPRYEVEETSSPDMIVEADDLMHRIDAAVESLPPRCKEAFLLSRIEGLTHAQVANRMGISLSQVEKYIVRGLRCCRQVVAQDTRSSSG